jgi:predicted MPP superfamily phosphohydrolase
MPDPVIREIRLTYANLPESFCGFTMLHLTDLHADGVTGLADAISERLRHLEVDLCVMTGDYRFEVRGPCHGIYHPMEHILKSVNARLGVVGILGNHDVSEEIPALERLGVRMLINEAIEVRRGRDSTWVIGVDDPHYYGCDDLPAALRNVPSEAFKILLVHTPEIITEAEASGVDLYLCGHTHGGQVCLPFIGPIITNANCSEPIHRECGCTKRYKGIRIPVWGHQASRCGFVRRRSVWSSCAVPVTRACLGLGTPGSNAAERPEIVPSPSLAGVR